MKQKLIIIGVFLLIALILVALNAASYTQRQKNPETEMFPNRSSFNSGPTGTLAFYTLLSETGRKVIRWQEPADALQAKRKNAPTTFVVIGRLRRDFSELEFTSLLRWVSAGGRLVVIDREPADDLVKTTANWSLELKQHNTLNLLDSDPSDQKKMTAGTPAAKPVQPSLFAFGVNAIQPSQYASLIVFERLLDAAKQSRSVPTLPPPPRKAKLSNSGDDAHGTSLLLAPVVHIASSGKNILVDVPFGSGRIVFLSDPFIVSNGGISMVDNAQLGVNIVSNGDGLIAFDEYHQGFGNNQNRLFEFFAGTPVVAIFFQCLLLVGLVFLSQSRRFGRALPDEEPDRLSKLEYVAAMAELQQRTRVFDLAIENIYRDFRRRAARLVGVDNMSTPMHRFAVVIAERAQVDRKEVEGLMFKCEDIIAGERTNKREVLDLTTRIRKLEHALGLRRRISK